MQRIEVALQPGIFDGQGHIDAQRVLDSLGLDVGIETRLGYTVNLGISDEQAAQFAAELHNSKMQRAVVDGSFDGEFDHVIRVGYRPGVMDPVGKSAKFLAGVVLGEEFGLEQKVAAQELKFISSETPLTDVQLRKIAGLFANDIIQDTGVWGAEAWKQGVDPYMPEVYLDPEPVRHYDLSTMSDHALMQLSVSRCLALNLEEMHKIQAYYQRDDVKTAREKVGMTAEATDVELELFAQTWSEHCKHKIFNADITYRGDGLEEKITDGIFSRFIKTPTRAIQEQKPDFIKSVLWDNSGVIDLHGSLANYFCFKCETHNSPSNLEPYGGSITGIVGVYRDPMGTGRGSRVNLGVWGYCTGSIFYDGDLRPPLHPEQLLMGVHWGNRDGGNKHGVPNAIGNWYVDPCFMGKSIVFVGAGGLIPKEIGGTPGYEKTVNPGDRVVVVGGRVGKDGIHGATASSEMYHKERTPAQHVQIGDPYTQKNVQEFILEALERNLIRYSQDSGAGGTGSAAGEMAERSNGAVIDLDKDLFKYDGLACWEIMISESQERMFLAIDPDNMSELEKIADKWGVEMRDIKQYVTLTLNSCIMGSRR
jgi:phosphoribosylformylglycinamidine synthase